MIKTFLGQSHVHMTYLWTQVPKQRYIGFVFMDFVCVCNVCKTRRFDFGLYFSVKFVVLFSQVSVPNDYLPQKNGQKKVVFQIRLHISKIFIFARTDVWSSGQRLDC